MGHGADRRPRRRRRRQLLRGHRPRAPGRPGHRRAGRGPSRRRTSSRCGPAPSSTPPAPTPRRCWSAPACARRAASPSPATWRWCSSAASSTAAPSPLQTKYRDPSAVLTRGPRHLFLVPWRGRTLVGVNSLIWRDEPDRLRVTEAEVSRLRRRDRRGGSEARPHHGRRRPGHGRACFRSRRATRRAAT